MRGELFFPQDARMRATVECEVKPYRQPDDPQHVEKISYRYIERPRKGFEFHKDVPLTLRLEDGRELQVQIQYEATTPDGQFIGLLRILNRSAAEA